MKAQNKGLVALVVLAAVAVGGCGGSSGGNKEKTSAGPKSPSAKEKIVGTWHGKVQIDQAAFEKKLAEIPGDEEKQLLRYQVEASKALTLKLELNADGTMKGAIGSDEGSGNWNVVTEDGNKVTIEMTEIDEDGEVGEPDTKEVTFVSDDVITMEVPGESMKNVALLRLQRLR